MITTHTSMICCAVITLVRGNFISPTKRSKTVLWLILPGESLGETGDLAGPGLGVRALLLPSKVLTRVQGDRCGPPGVWAPVPERCEEERDEQGEVVAPEPAVFITLECSGVCRLIADRMLFPFIPVQIHNRAKGDGTEKRDLKRAFSRITTVLDEDGG